MSWQNKKKSQKTSKFSNFGEIYLIINSDTDNS